MGQIVSTAAKPKRCNKNKLSQLGVLAAGLHVLVSSDNSMNAAGQGNFDCYIVGDGTTAATALELKPVEGSSVRLTELEGEISDLELEIDGEALVPKLLVWTDGYLNGGGKLASSTVSKFSQPVFLKAGEKIVYNSSEEYLNAVVSVADDTPIGIGDTLSYTRLIIYYPDKAGTTVEYTADNDVWIVITISKSNYTLQFVAYKDESVKEQLADTKDTNAKISQKVDLVTGIEEIYADNAYVNGSTFEYDAGWFISQLLPIQSGDTITITVPSDITASSTQKGVVFDQNKQYVTYFSLGNRSIVVSSQSAAYAAISIRKSDAEKFSLSANNEKIFGYAAPFVLQKEIEDLQNIELKYDNFLRGYALAGGGNPGEFVEMSGCGISEFIPLDAAGKTLTIRYGELPTVTIGAIYIYDAQKNFLEFYNTSRNSTYRTVNVSDSLHSAFVRISFNLSYSSAGLYVGGLLAWSPTFENAHTRGFINYLNASEISPLDEVINRAKQSLITACRYGYGDYTNEVNNRKDCQMLIMTDTHTFTEQIQDHIDTCEKVETIDGMLLCGDYTLTNYNPQQAQEFIDQIKVITKPIALCLGNHDVGYHYYCGNSASHQQVYDSFIAPLVAAGKITNYTSGVPYYYVDDENHKVRFICVYEYDGDLAVDETHWELVVYDATKPMISKTATYNQGDIVNVPQYTSGSFKAKETIDMTGASEYNKNKYPSYKVQRDDRVIRETQANWLASTLLSTPEGYKVVILTHQHFSSKSATQTNFKFCIDQNYASGLVSESMQTDLIADMVDAFMNKQNFVEKVVMKGDATYMNTIPDGQGGYYAYEVQADFSNLGNVGFLCYINGHDHRDMIWRHNTYTRQWGISSSQAGYFYEYNADIRRSKEDVSSRNTITVISFDNDHDAIRLVKVGNQHTIDGRLRDFEVIDLNP